MAFFGLASGAVDQVTLIQFSDVQIAKNMPKYGSLALLSRNVAPVYGDDDNQLLSGSIRVRLQDACKVPTTAAHYDDIKLETLLKLYADADMTQPCEISIFKDAMSTEGLYHMQPSLNIDFSCQVSANPDSPDNSEAQLNLVYMQKDALILSGDMKVQLGAVQVSVQENTIVVIDGVSLKTG